MPKVNETSLPGAKADKPTAIPRRGWWQILKRTKRAIADDHLDIVSAGIAFYAMLAIFPGITALVSLYGLFADPSDVRSHLQSIAGLLPDEAWKILDDQLVALASAENTKLGIGAAISLALAVWSASRAMKVMMSALNIVYGERETRGFFRLNALALIMCLGGIVAVVLWIGLIVVTPVVLDLIWLGETAETVISVSRWPALAILFMIALAVLFRLAPDRAAPRWRWVTVGSVLALFLWIAVSVAFAWYVANFGNYDKTYGSVGAIIVLLLWFYLSTFIVLIGAELNAEIEHQTARDSTVGAPAPLGARGARVADTRPLEDS